MDEMKLRQAKVAFATLCKALDNIEWRYTKDEENLSIDCGAQGEDLPIEIVVKVDAKRLVVSLYSRLPCVVQEDKRVDVAIAICAINDALVDGCFDYDITTGRIFFRMTNSFMESVMSEEVFSYMLFCSCSTVDAYNDKLLMLAKDMLPLDKFLAIFND